MSILKALGWKGFSLEWQLIGPLVTAVGACLLYQRDHREELIFASYCRCEFCTAVVQSHYCLKEHGGAGAMPPGVYEVRYQGQGVDGKGIQINLANAVRKAKYQWPDKGGAAGTAKS
ncbi:hypothetical protein TWF281_001711 [Arthrobotrys megalospora]